MDEQKEANGEADIDRYQCVFSNRQKENRPKRYFQNCLHSMED
jgi:hypothetical protein